MRADADQILLWSKRIHPDTPPALLYATAVEVLSELLKERERATPICRTCKRVLVTVADRKLGLCNVCEFW